MHGAHQVPQKMSTIGLFSFADGSSMSLTGPLMMLSRRYGGTLSPIFTNPWPGQELKKWRTIKAQIVLNINWLQQVCVITKSFLVSLSIEVVHLVFIIQQPTGSIYPDIRLCS